MGFGHILEGTDHLLLLFCLVIPLRSIRALIPVVTIVGMHFRTLMAGAVLTETVFAWPGTGMMLNTAIFQRDIPVLQATTLVLALFFVVLNLLVDLIQTAIDPRISRR